MDAREREEIETTDNDYSESSSASTRRIEFASPRKKEAEEACQD